MPGAMVNGGGDSTDVCEWPQEASGRLKPRLEGLTATKSTCVDWDSAAKAGLAGLGRMLGALLLSMSLLMRRLMLLGLAALRPGVELQHAAEVKAAADVAGSHVARPVGAQVDARRADQRDHRRARRHDRPPQPREPQVRHRRRGQEAEGRQVVHDMAAGEAGLAD